MLGIFVPIPQADKEHQDILDLITDACMKEQMFKQSDGTMRLANIIDSEKVWWKTLLINHSTFGRFAYVLKSYESLAQHAQFFMSSPRAKIIESQIIHDVENYKISMDAKSSETLRDKNNTQNSLIHIATRNKVEKQYTLKDDTTKSMWEGLKGKDPDPDR